MADHFGLDIGSNSIKIVQLQKDKNLFRLVAAGLIKTPAVDMSFENEKDIVLVAEAIKKLKNESKVTTKNIVIAIPERSVFSRIIEVPKMSDNELSSAIPWEAENVVPMPIGEVNLDWEIIPDEESDKNNKFKVLLVAVPSVLINRYLKIIKMADLVPVTIEADSLSIIRCLRPFFNQGNMVILNMGARSLDIILVSHGNFFLTRQLPSAGEGITRAISNSLGMDMPTAEEYKKTYGLTNQFEGKIYNVIEPILAVAANEINKMIRFYGEKIPEPMKVLVLGGGTSLLPGINEYFTKVLNLEVQTADPLSLLLGDMSNMQSLKKNSPLFTVACGLAIKNT